MPQKVMIVDDEPAIVRLIASRLRGDGHVIQEASGGREALAKVEADPPDLVVLDLSMPDLDGWHVAHTLKSDARYQRIPILVLSALVEDDGPGHPPEEAEYLMGKPFQLEELSRTVGELLRREH